MALMLMSIMGALVNLDHPGHYIHVGFVQISVANLIVIALIVVVFAVVIALPFPKEHGDDHHA